MRFFRFDTYEKKGLGIGISFALLLILFMQLGLAPILGSLPDLMGIVLGLIGCCKYIGKGFDSIAELRKQGKTSNQKLATLVASVAGIGLALTAYFAHFELIQSIIHVLNESLNLPTWFTLPILFLGFAGTAAAAGDKLGQAVDIVTQKTAVDASRSAGDKLSNYFPKKNSDYLKVEATCTLDSSNSETKTESPSPISTSPSKSINTIATDLIPLLPNPPAPGKYEKRGVIIGLVLAVVILGVILGGLVPVTGGLPVIVGLMFGLIGCPKYIGKAFDCVLEIKKEGKTTNQKLATLGGCAVGLGLAIASICLPGFAFLNTTINALIQVVQLPAWIHTPFVFLGLIGTAAGGADKIGQFVDGFTNRTIIDVGRSLFNKIKTCFAKNQSTMIQVIEASEIPTPMPSQQDTNSAGRNNTYARLIRMLTEPEGSVTINANKTPALVPATNLLTAETAGHTNDRNISKTNENPLLNAPDQTLPNASVKELKHTQSLRLESENPKKLLRTYSLMAFKPPAETVMVKRQLSMSHC